MNTGGAIEGAVREPGGIYLEGVTVVATSPSLWQPQTVITDDRGAFRISGLPPGEYLVTFYYGNDTDERAEIQVRTNHTTPLSEMFPLQRAPKGDPVPEMRPVVPLCFYMQHCWI